MSESLQEELKDFEKALSLLLVRFMKICDQVELAKGGAPGPVHAKPSAPTPAPPPKLDFQAAYI